MSDSDRAFELRHLIREFHAEVSQLREWVLSIPESARPGGWDSAAYPGWGGLHLEFKRLVKHHSASDWDPSLLDDVLYALALDGDVGNMIGTLQRSDKAALLLVSEWAARVGAPDAQWQCAFALGRCCSLEEAQELLLRFVVASDDYVRGVALQALAHLGSDHAEALALQHWQHAEPRPWTQMSALSALFELQSAHLDPLLLEAESSSDELLRDHAKRLREVRSG
jgi:hypothetical protein